MSTPAINTAASTKSWSVNAILTLHGTEPEDVTGVEHLHCKVVQTFQHYYALKKKIIYGWE